MMAALVAALLAAEPMLPERAEVEPTFACPGGTERIGARPPDGFESWCERPSEPPQRRRQGPAFTWYDDGQLARATSFDGGLQEGTFVEWHRNGKVARSGTFHAGEREGTWLLFFESGRREEQCGYLHGNRHGPFASWWPNGRPRVEGRYCHGLQCGTWISWDEDGRELGKMTYEEIRGTP